MKLSLPIITVVIAFTIFLTGCDFLGGIFKTGIGVGIFIAVLVLVLIFFIGRIGRRRP
ncbi:MAG TPA: hypothetical protein VHO46_08440 [Bacteroidales bacterium]|nr:hypothetical protein [Bacteroidales bacterium]